jgi:hypothetical protein
VLALAHAKKPAEIHNGVPHLSRLLVDDKVINAADAVLSGSINVRSGNLIGSYCATEHWNISC